MVEAHEAKQMTFQDRMAVRIVDIVGSMGCAYVFAFIALCALPDKLHEAITNGFHPAPLIEWFSQSFLQLVLLAIIMVGQDVKARMAQENLDEAHVKLDAMHERLQHHHGMLHRIHEHIHGKS